MKFFEVKLAVRARESLVVGFSAHRVGSQPGVDQFEDYELTVTLHMGDSATPDDAVKELARRLEEVCNDAPPYSGG